MSVEQQAIEKINEIKNKLVGIGFDQDQYNWLLFSVVKEYICGFIEYCEGTEDLYDHQCVVLRKIIVDGNQRGQHDTLKKRLIDCLDQLLVYIKESEIENKLMEYDKLTYFDTNITVVASYTEYIRAKELGLAV